VWRLKQSVRQCNKRRKGAFMRGYRFIVFGGICLVAFSCTTAFGQGKVKVIKPKQAPAPAAQPSSEPDKVLYDRAMADLKKKRYVEERLSLETLINTYPDSEYLDKAKLAVADSYYTEGGVSNLTQAIGEYKSFVVFFPGDDKAPYAQMQIGMAHYKMMEKSDRDNSEALSAEAELQTFITKYPDDKLVPVAEQKLRDVQEVIADGEYKVARFYYLRPDYRASAARLVELTERYPLYSQSDQALWMLGDIYALMKNKGSRNEDDKNHWADLEGKVLDRIVTDYPLSPRAAQAKADLKAMGMPVPAADPAAVARMQKQEAFIKAHRQSTIKEPLALLKTGPDLLLAAQSGTPNLTPPADSITAKDILSPTAAGPAFNLAADSGANSGGTDVSGSGASVTSVNDAAPSPAASNDENAIVSSPTTSSSDASPSASSDPVGQVDAPTTSSSSNAPAAPAATANGNAAMQSSTPAASQNGTATTPATPGTESSSKNESSSKKKKKLGKLNPF
jgi:outer membrane protein assembly factor BamD